VGKNRSVLATLVHQALECLSGRFRRHASQFQGSQASRGPNPKKVHGKTTKTLSFGSSTKHKQAINISLVAFGYVHQGCVSAT
jgi:hypothetical protein